MVFKVRIFNAGYKINVEDCEMVEIFEPKNAVEVEIPALPKLIVADDFVKGANGISYVSPTFQDLFYDIEEEPSEKTSLVRNELLGWANDPTIITKLGGKPKVATKFNHVKYLMSKQPEGESGTLSLTEWNVFYCFDKNGNLCAVSVDWSGDGWRVYANSADDPDGWDGGRYFFSPPLLSKLKPLSA